MQDWLNHLRQRRQITKTLGITTWFGNMKNGGDGHIMIDNSKYSCNNLNDWLWIQFPYNLGLWQISPLEYSGVHRTYNWIYLRYMGTKPFPKSGQHQLQACYRYPCDLRLSINFWESSFEQRPLGGSGPFVDQKWENQVNINSTWHGYMDISQERLVSMCKCDEMEGQCVYGGKR